jgi:hypothetical protein
MQNLFSLTPVLTGIGDFGIGLSAGSLTAARLFFPLCE